MTPHNSNTADLFYNCPICQDTGLVREVIDGVEYFKHCKCTIEKNNKRRIVNSGLSNVLEKYTFDNYITKDKWQAAIKQKAIEYSKNPQGWFFIGGQSGSGKSHICTAICAELLKNRPVIYMSWVEENTKLKALRNNEELYEQKINLYKRIDVLYIDDFFKTQQGGKATAADVMTAYELLNYRYLQKAGTTVISSELSCDEIMEIDGATGGRIYEKTKGNMIYLGKGKDKNYRLK